MLGSIEKVTSEVYPTPTFNYYDFLTKYSQVPALFFQATKYMYVYMHFVFRNCKSHLFLWLFYEWCIHL